MRIIECEQYSPEWWAARAGLPTASNADRIITASGKPSASADAYIAELIDEVVRPLDQRSREEQAAAFQGNRHTDRGNAYEPKAREWHRLVTGAKVREVGLIISADGRTACSPDVLVLADKGLQGGAEFKAPEGKKHVLWMLEGGLPKEHRQQVHFSLATSDLDFWDFVSYCPGYKPFKVRVTPDDYTETLRGLIDGFCDRLAKAKEQFIDYLPIQEAA
jgi:hypothetical protein